MLSQDRNDRALPTLITLLVVGILLMTFDVRLSGGGVVSVLRSGTQAIVAPLQEAASFVVNPVTDLIDDLSNVASLREQNAALSAELAETQAELVAVQDQLARLEHLESLYGLDTDEQAIGRTVANVIGIPDAFDSGIFIDKGTADGIVVGQPVIDTNGYVVGTVKSVGPSSATVVPITSSRAAVTVQVGTQVGTLTSQIATSEMRLEVFDAREPILEGDRVVTSAASVAYPAGLAVGLIVADAAPQTGSLLTAVEPFVDPEGLRLVVVLAWPPDPIDAAAGPVLTETTTTTDPVSPETSPTVATSVPEDS